FVCCPVQQPIPLANPSSFAAGSDRSSSSDGPRALPTPVDLAHEPRKYLGESAVLSHGKRSALESWYCKRDRLGSGSGDLLYGNERNQSEWFGINAKL